MKTTNLLARKIAEDQPHEILFDKYVTDIEGFIPDLCGDELDHDSVYCFACDYIYDREWQATHVDNIRAAAKLIATYYCGV